jgi:mediator of RNA polymerase II transcription subunit 13
MRYKISLRRCDQFKTKIRHLGAEWATIVSACLVSLEPDSQFRMMTDQVTPDERFGQQSPNSNLSTPESASCTHILVFPTSATTRVSIPDFRNANLIKI